MQATKFTTVAEAINDNIRFTPEIVLAIKHARASKLFQGTLQERQEKFRKMHTELSEAMGVKIKLEFASGTSLSRVGRRRNTGIIHGRLSLVTYLHLVAQAAEYDANGQLTFAVNLFRKYFPRSFANCQQIGIYLVKKK